MNKSISTYVIGSIIAIVLVLMYCLIAEDVRYNMHQSMSMSMTIEKCCSTVEDQKSAIDECMRIMKDNNCIVETVKTYSYNSTLSVVTVHGKAVKTIATENTKKE